MLNDALGSAEPVQLELDRNLCILYPSQAAKQVELPPVFFTMSPEELKREQQLRYICILNLILSRQSKFGRRQGKHMFPSFRLFYFLQIGRS